MSILKNLIELIESNKTNEVIEFLKNNINEISDKDLLNVYFKITNQENYHLLNSFFNLIKKEQLVKCINNSYINKIIVNRENKKAIDNIYALLYFKENLHETFIDNIFSSSIQLKNTETFNYILKNFKVSNEYLAEKLKELLKDNIEENNQYISSIISSSIILPNDADLLSSLPPNILKKNYIPHITFKNITEDTVEKIYEKIYTIDFKYSPNYIEIANLIVKDRRLSSSKK
ncbi:MAG: hypothetical protein N2485_08455, partial [bacterium]|nr:hypothetical protein [bacterium]